MNAAEKVNSIASLLSPLLDPLSDYAGMKLDSVLQAITESGFLKEVPVIRNLVAGTNFSSAVQSAHFIKKYGTFIGIIARNIPSDERIKLIDEIEKNPEIAGKITEKTIIALDRYQNRTKAVLLAQLFVKTFFEHEFLILEYNKLLFSIELMHPTDSFKCLTGFYNYRIKLETESNEKKREMIRESGASMDYSSLSASGLLSLQIGSSSSGNTDWIRLNDLGLRFYEEVYLPVEIEIRDL